MLFNEAFTRNNKFKTIGRFLSGLEIYAERVFHLLFVSHGPYSVEESWRLPHLEVATKSWTNLKASYVLIKSSVFYLAVLLTL